MRVQQHDWQRPLRGDWVARLEEVLLSKIELPTQSLRRLEANLAQKSLATDASEHHDGVWLVAHSLGCHLVAAWAAASKNTTRVRGALLVAPPNPTQADWPTDLHSWRQPVLQRLPFAATCVVSSNDPFDTAGRGPELATAWGAHCVHAGARGHINGDSGLGDWPQGHALLQQLAAGTVPTLKL